MRKGMGGKFAHSAIAQDSMNLCNSDVMGAAMKRALQYSAVLGVVAVGCSPFPTATSPPTETSVPVDSAIPEATTTVVPSTVERSISSVAPIGPASEEDADSSTAPSSTSFDEWRSWPKDAASLATELSEIELSIRQLDGVERTAEELAPIGRRQQLLYRLLDNNRAWVDEVLAAADSRVAGAVELNWTARNALSALVQSEGVHDTLPAWHIIEPEPADRLLSLYKAAEAETGVPWTYLAAINLIETRTGRITGVSSAGAVGPMQFLPTTWAECCEGDPTDPADAIPGAATYLVVRGGPEDMAKAVRGYNNSGYYVDAVTAVSSVLAADEDAYFAFHAWEVNFLSSAGLLRLPVGYRQETEVDASQWLAENPDRLLLADS